MKNNHSYPNPSYQWKKISSLLVCILVVGLGIASAQTGIEGNWKNPKKGIEVLIYEENGAYFGQLIASDKPEENAKIQEQEKIVLLRNFKKESDTKFCCGKIYQPKNKRSISATLILEDDNRLKINGKYGLFKGSQVWTRI